MFYVYVIQSIGSPNHFYVGYTDDLKLRMGQHNRGSCRTTNKYKPWKLRAYFAFDCKEKAENFEIYLKSHSGRIFQKKYL